MEIVNHFNGFECIWVDKKSNEINIKSPERGCGHASDGRDLGVVFYDIWLDFFS